MDNIYYSDQLAMIISRRIFFKYIPLTIILFSLAGCHMLEKLYLKAPTKAPSQEILKLKQPNISNEFVADSVVDMMGRIEVHFSANDTNRDISSILQDGLSFLVKEFGPPVYQGRVLLVISDDPSDNAYILWRGNDDLEREININHYNVMKPMWHHYLVHELFHAFWQSVQFQKMFPDLIIEGLAIYAQYKYHYKEMSNDQIREQIYKEAVELRPNSNREGIDFSRPFQSYGEQERKYLYLVSGLLFFNQDPERIRETINRLLWSPPCSDKKMPFERIVKVYDLDIDDEIFQQSDKTSLALSAPRKIVFNPDQATVKVSGPDKGKMIQPDTLNTEVFQPISGASDR